jgi:hypothetical protein
MLDRATRQIDRPDLRFSLKFMRQASPMRVNDVLVRVDAGAKELMVENDVPEVAC